MKFIPEFIDILFEDPRDVPIGTTATTSKGFKFTLLKRDESGKELWKDETSGLIWFDKENKNYNHRDAMKEFNSESKRLPTIEEFKEAEKHGFREVLPNINNYWFWSASVNPSFVYSAFVFFGGICGDIVIGVRYDNYINAVLCVGR
jgi:hypothetical protein